MEHQPLKKKEPTPTYLQWCKFNRLLHRWIIGTLTEEAFGVYTHNSQEHEFYLTQQLTYLQKERSTSLAYHFRTFKGMCDNLISIDKSVADKMKAFALLNSLEAQYKLFIASMLKPLMPTYAKIISLLQGYEIRTSLHDLVNNHSFTFYG